MTAAGGTTSDEAGAVTEQPAVTVYWRPGCGFCSSLFRGLQRAGIEYDRVDIWQDDEAAAYVRSVADGSETVPTVRIGEIALVNPSAARVAAALEAQASDDAARGDADSGRPSSD